MHKAVRNIDIPNKRMSIIIPCAGLGYRMKTYGAKCLIKINNESILDRQLRLFKKHFSEYEVILTTGFQASRIERCIPAQVKTVYNPYYADTNVVHSLALALTKTTTNNILIVYGDLVFNNAALKFNCDYSKIIINNYMKHTEVGCTFHNNTLEQIFYNLNNKWSQMIYLTGNELAIMKKIVNNTKNHVKFGFEAINDLINLGGNIKISIPKNAMVYDIDFYKDIATAENIK